jgi:acyl dehydratase
MTTFRDYADLHVGARFPDEPARYAVTADVVNAYRTLGGGNPVGESCDIAPPTIAAVYIRPAQNALNGPPGGIHAKQKFEFLKSVAVGDRLETVLEIKELFERIGRRFVVSETRTTNQNNDLVCIGLITQVWGQDQ